MNKEPEIGQIDKNLHIEETILRDDVHFWNVREADVDLYGLYQPRQVRPFLRMPPEVAETVSESVVTLNRKTAGGRLRFRTDSPFVAIRMTRKPRKSIMSHMAYTGSSGFDCYVREAGTERFVGSFIPATKLEPGYESLLELGDAKLRDIVIHFPLYDTVDELWLGLQEGSTLQPGTPYDRAEPVLFYGSSITQGGCASRPGNCYTAMVCRWLNCDHVNLGFSGSAKGEPAIAEYIAKQKMAVFVMDYDHNSKTKDLQSTHWELYDTVRKAQPDLPIIMATMCDLAYRQEDRTDDLFRRSLIRENYQRALDAGDKRLWFLDGQTVYAAYGGADCTVDGAHPNDLGFYAMAKAFYPYLKKALEVQP